MMIPSKSRFAGRTQEGDGRSRLPIVIFRAQKETAELRAPSHASGRCGKATPLWGRLPDGQRKRKVRGGASGQHGDNLGILDRVSFGIPVVQMGTNKGGGEAALFP
ncbi:hypothetical protein NL676_017768 [Syzygium grande]|nr:hypothetical protein NL676_017768 [Syzygium grande]